MKSKFQRLTKGLFAALMVVGISLCGTSCTDSETTDSSKFTIHYAGITDIGPSMNFTLSGPTYLGSAPSDFAITRVTLNGEDYQTDCFQIENASTGSIKIENTANLPVGTYRISISCVSGGDVYDFPDAITINMLAPVPDGISVSPEVVTVDLADIFGDEAAAQVKTEESSHVHISKYAIIQEEGKEYFAISSTGKITVNSKYTGEILPGKYVLNLKLTTGAGEGIYENAVTFNITSSPLQLLYTPNSVKVETGQGYTSAEPFMKGSTEGLTYALKSVTPATDAISIDAQTGVISLAENNSLAIGDKYDIAVTVTNQYGTADFDNVFTMNIVAYINPITKLAYDDQEAIQATAFEFAPTDVDGDELTYTLENLDAALDGQLTIDPTTGKVSAKKGNSIPVGNYNVTVKAANGKSEQTATIKLNITKNPYYFTYIHWGNNLGLTPAKNYASQYRLTKKGQIARFTIPVAESDLPEGQEVTWKIEKNSIGTKPDIDANGTITLKDKEDGTSWWVANKVFYILVSATTGKGTNAETVVKVPVFIHCSAAVASVTVEYTPFVFQVNPKTGGSSVAPTITGVDASMLKFDYRRNFQYYNINGPAEHKDGQPSVAGSFMNTVWGVYWSALNKTNNTGARGPMSYIDNTNYSLPLGYVNQDDNNRVKINPNKWMDENGYANGIMIGQMTFATDGNNASVGPSGNQMFPIAIWLDEKF